MIIYKILIESAKKESTVRAWCLAQRAYCHSKISLCQLRKIQNELINTDKKFFRVD